MNLFHINFEMLIGKNDGLEFENAVEYDHNKLLTTMRDNKEWILQSQMSMTLPIKTWCNQFENVNYHTTLIIFGMGITGYIFELAQKYPDNLIVVYEPDETIILKQLGTEEFSELLSKKNIYWIAGKHRKKMLCKLVDEQFDYKNGVAIEMGVMPNYKKIYSEEYSFFNEQIMVAKAYSIATRNTMVDFEKDRGKCYLHNIFDAVIQSNVQNLVDAFQGIDLSGFPAVIISAGPSLDKNVKELVPYQNNAFIICVDSAIRTALKWGITPDLLVCVDPLKNPDLFKNELGENLPLLTHLNCNYAITQTNKGRRFYSSDKEPFEIEIFGKYKKQLGVLATGGTVASNAFSIAIKLGFKTIILIGQDLAYPNKRAHAEDAKAEWDIEEGNSRYFYVNGIDGNPVLTEANMSLYRKWFEEQIVKYPDINVIDATEGGALISGSRVMTLHEALIENCMKKEKCFLHIIQNANFLLSPDEQNDAISSILEAINNVPCTIELLKSQYALYEELDTLNRKSKYRSSAFKNCIHRITEFNNAMDENLSILLMQLFGKKGDFEIYDKLQERVSSQFEEIIIMVEVGKKLLDTYIDAGEKLLKVWAEIKEQI